MKTSRSACSGKRITEVVDKWMATAAGEWFVEKRKVDQKGHVTSILPKSIFTSVFILFQPPLPPYEPRFQEQMNNRKEMDGGLTCTNSAPPSTGFLTFNSGNNALVTMPIVSEVAVLSSSSKYGKYNRNDVSISKLSWQSI
jgi:hypothetical protein